MGRVALTLGQWGTIAVRRLEDGRYRASCRYGHPDGKSRELRATGASPAEAKRVLVTRLSSRINELRQWEPSTQSSKSFNEVAEEWFSDLARSGRPASTLRRYEEQLRIHLKPRIGSRPITDITRASLQQLLREYILQGRYARARGLRSVLIAVFRFAMEQEWVDSNVARATSSVARPRREVRVLTADQVTRLRDVARRRAAVGGKDRLPVDLIIDVILGAGGLRVGEALALKWQHVDLDSRVPTITVRGTVIEVALGPDAWQKGLHVQDRPKSSTSFRTVPVPAWLVKRLRQRQRDEGLIFATRTGRPYSKANFSRSWRSVRDEAGLPDATAHDLRRYIATLVARAHDIDTASKLLGHASVQVTEQHYIERAKAAPDVRATLEALDNGHSVDAPNATSSGRDTTGAVLDSLTGTLPTLDAHDLARLRRLLDVEYARRMEQ